MGKESHSLTVLISFSFSFGLNHEEKNVFAPDRGLLALLDRPLYRELIDELDGLSSLTDQGISVRLVLPSNDLVPPLILSHMLGRVGPEAGARRQSGTKLIFGSEGLGSERKLGSRNADSSSSEIRVA